LKKQEYKGVTSESKLLLRGEEGFDVEFKRSISGLTTEDLVAFANSDEGGVIFIGVEEIKKKDGRKIGNIVGCKIGDEEKQKIIDRGISCIPQIKVYVIAENTDGKPILRIDIPSGPQKPYCTSNGTYKIRGDGRNVPITPELLLEMFMEKEGAVFIDRFRNATKQLEISLERLLDRTEDLDATLQSTFESAENTGGLADDALGFSEQAADGIEQVSNTLEQIEEFNLYDLHEKIDALLAHFGIEEPRKKAARIWVEDKTVELHKNGAEDIEILETLTKIWQGDGINGAWFEVFSWYKNKLDELREQETQDRTK